MEEEKIGNCKSCHLEFDVYADDVIMLAEPKNGSCLIKDIDGRAHEILFGERWEKYVRRKEYEDDGYEVGTQYRKTRENEDIEDDPLVTSLEDAHKEIADGESQRF
jgi:hypothetical protein